jgi:hypothetical protein
MDQRQLLAQAMRPSFAAGGPTPVEIGNIDLYHRPVHRNPDGSISTVHTMGFNLGGLETNLPTVGPNGEMLTPEQALQLYGRTGQHLGRFRSIEDAERAAQLLHLDQQRLYGLGGRQ